MNPNQRTTFHEVELRVTFIEDWRKRQRHGFFVGLALINIGLLWSIFAASSASIGCTSLVIVNTVAWHVYTSKQIETELQHLVYIIAELLRNPPRQILVSTKAEQRTAQEVLDLLVLLEGLKDAIVAQTDVLHADLHTQSALLDGVRTDLGDLYGRLQKIREIVGAKAPTE